MHVDVIDCVSGSLNVGEVLQHSCMMLAELNRKVVSNFRLYTVCVLWRSKNRARGRGKIIPRMPRVSTRRMTS